MNSAPEIDEEVFVSREQLITLFAEAAQVFVERAAPLFVMQGYRRVALLLAEHPANRALFWLIAPLPEGRFLSMLPFTTDGEALIDPYNPDWPEVQRWRMIARLPLNLTGAHV